MIQLDYKKLECLLFSVEQLVEEKQDRMDTLGLKFGRLGLSLFYFGLYDYFKIDRYKTNAIFFLEDCFDKLNSGYVSHELYREIADLGTFVEYAVNANWIDSSTKESLIDIDTLLYDELHTEINKGNFDPINGALFYGYYFLSRSENCTLKTDAIISIVEFIDSISHRSDKGRYWKSKLKGDDSIYLGISHGISNIIIFLVYALRGKVLNYNSRIQSILEESCSFISNSKLLNHPLLFPIIIGKENETGIHSKNYCYGDHSTLYGLLEGYRYLNNKTAGHRCIAMFEEIERRGYNEPYLNAGYGLLYGRAGISMIYRRLYEITHHPFFEIAHKKQIECILNVYSPVCSDLGYKGYWNQHLEHTNYCFNEGIIGIAMELMSLKGNAFHDQFFFLKNPTEW